MIIEQRRRDILWSGVFSLSAFLAGCNAPSSSGVTKPDPPAKVVSSISEAALNTVTLTADAEKRLGITTTRITQEAVQYRKTIGGELIVPYGKTIMVSAPVAGTIVAGTLPSLPAPGFRVQAGDTVLTLQPLLSPERDIPTSAERVQIANARATLISAQTVAAGDVERGKAEVDAARIALTRAQQLLRDRAGSAKAVDDAQAQLNIVEAAAHSAHERQLQLQQLASQLDPRPSDDHAVPMPVTAPQSGLIRTLNVSEGQTVTAGTTLFEIVDLSTMWVRVPVYVGLLSRISPSATAELVELGALGPSTADVESGSTAGPSHRIARPVVAPPSADPLSSTADLFFEVDNSDGRLRPGQRIGMQIVLAERQDARIAPASSLICDVHGNNWVYVRVHEHQFERRRVELLFNQGDQAILAMGPDVGTEIVVEGVAELYGTEFGAGK